jgi:hypothetical protein
MRKFQHSLAAYIVLATATLLSSYSSASLKYECTSIFADNALGWMPEKFSITLDNGQVTEIKSDTYKYKGEQIKVLKAHKKRIKLQYNSSYKANNGQSYGTIHIIEILPEENTIWYTLSFPGYSNFYRGRGVC